MVDWKWTERLPDAEHRKRYKAYLASPEWRQIREAAKALARYRCQVCNDDEELNVHHRTYERLGAEDPQDLTVLCKTCHKLFHKRRKLVGSKTLSSGTRKAKRRIDRMLKRFHQNRD